MNITRYMSPFAAGTFSLESHPAAVPDANQEQLNPLENLMMRTKTTGIKALALGSFALVTLGACGGSGTASDSSASSGNGGGGAQVTLSGIDNEFEPTDLTVPGGGEVTVEFTNNGETVHTFTSEELGFDTGNVLSGESKTVTFTAPDGETEFVCTIHAESDDMVGTIVVE